MASLEQIRAKLAAAPQKPLFRGRYWLIDKIIYNCGDSTHAEQHKPEIIAEYERMILPEKDYTAMTFKKYLKSIGVSIDEKDWKLVKRMRKGTVYNSVGFGR